MQQTVAHQGPTLRLPDARQQEVIDHPDHHDKHGDSGPDTFAERPAPDPAVRRHGGRGQGQSDQDVRQDGEIAEEIQRQFAYAFVRVSAQH
ncbi:hypothetical protein D3C80_1855830 [compost metagenome]